MLSALLYLQWHGTKNRMVARLRRLRQPKYLFGALVGGAYLYLNFLRFFLPVPGHARFGRGGANFVLDVAAFTPLLETLGALVLCVVVLLAWMVPRERAALAFSEAETAFLFPAPVSRRALLHWKLLRSQMAILFTILFLTLMTGGRFRFGAHVWMQAAGWWVILSTLSLHLLAVSFARTLLLERGLTPWRRRAVIGGCIVAALASVGWWAHNTLPMPGEADAVSLPAVLHYLQTVAEAPAVRWGLWPFRVPLRPFLAADARAFLLALGPAMALMAANYLWVIRSDVAFEEASLARSQRQADRLAARVGRGGGAAVPFKRRPAPFPLSPTGGPRLVAILWKNLLAAGQLFNVRVALAIGWVALAGGVGLGRTLRDSPWPPLLGLFALQFAGMALVFGPLLARQDLRSDLGNVDLLKTYPLPGWQIVLGELLAPAIVLTVVQWTLMALAAGLFLSRSDGLSVSVWTRAATPMLAAATVAPAFNFLSLLIPNAAVLLLPAWFQPTGPGGAPAGGRGVELLGQRLIFLLGQLIVTAVALLPALGVAGAVGLAAGIWRGGATPLAVWLASAAGAGVLIAEAAVALGPLGRMFERFDLSAELRPGG